MKHYLSIILLFFTFAASAQFRMVGNVSGSWTTVNDSTYTGTVNFQSDLTGQGYLANQIVDTFKLFTGTEKLYRVDSVWNTTFSAATMRLIRTNGTGAPAGQVMVFNPDGRQTIPQVPFGSTGSTAQLQAAVDTWNARIDNVGEGTTATVTTIAAFSDTSSVANPQTGDVVILDDGTGSATWDGDSWVILTGGGGNIFYDALTSGTVTAQVTRFAGSATTLTNPAGGEYNLVIASGADFQRAVLFGNNTTLNGSNEMIIRVNNAANSRDRRVFVQLYDAQNGALVDQQVTATVHTQAVSGNVTTITIPGLNGFGATGFYVEIR